MKRWELSGKVALITGASGGLGAHFAAVLAGAGAEVIIGARRQEALEQVTEAIIAQGGKCSSIRLDVACADSIATAAQVIDRIDILVNNAGVVRDGPALEQLQSDWDDVIDTNLKGMFLMSQAVGRAMRERGAGGAIINIASILGLRQAGGVLPYAVSKSGAIQMTKILALEFARYGIKVNALAPGYFDTELNSTFWSSDAGKAMLGRIPQRRLGRLADLDGPLLLLASDLSGYMTGSVIEVDGGHLLSTL